MAEIWMGSDHRGVALKAELAAWLKSDMGATVHDLGPQTESRTDHPLYAADVAKQVAAKPGHLGILICGSGQGMVISANKVPGAYAALCWSEEQGQLVREHNGANIVCFGADYIDTPTAKGVLKGWLAGQPLPGDYERRRKEVAAIEEGHDPRSLMS